MQEYTIYPLVVGINETDQGVMTYLRDSGKLTIFYCRLTIEEILPILCATINKIAKRHH